MAHLNSDHALRICIITSTPFPPGKHNGIANYVLNTANKLVERGHSVTIITRGSFTKTSSEIVNNVEIVRPPFIQAYPFHVHLHGIFVKKCIEALGSRLDIVHVHSPLSPPVKLSLPLVSTIHSSLLGDAQNMEVVDIKSLATKLQTWSVGHYLVSELIKNSDLVTTVSNAVSHELRKYYAECIQPVVIGNGVDERRFIPAETQDTGNYVLYVGRLTYKKGLFDLLKCATLLRMTDVSFVLAGEGELYAMLRRKVRDIGLQDMIRFEGHVNTRELIRLYQNASVFVFPSYYEGLPTAILEAMSIGLPVVATYVGGIREVIKDGENGVSIPPGAPNRMAEAISVLIQDRELRKKLGRNARRTIEESYTWDRVTDRLERCYSSLSVFK